ncbi:MAG: hypothetical protein AAGA97_00930 [Pseudomonadota bacterium]
MFDAPVALTLGRDMAFGVVLWAGASFLMHPVIANRYAEFHFIPACEADLEARLAELRRDEEPDTAPDDNPADSRVADDDPSNLEPSPSQEIIDNLNDGADHLPDWLRPGIKKVLDGAQMYETLRQLQLKQERELQDLTRDNLDRAEELSRKLDPLYALTFDSSSVCSCAVTGTLGDHSGQLTLHVASVRFYTPAVIKNAGVMIAQRIEDCANV